MPKKPLTRFAIVCLVWIVVAVISACVSTIYLGSSGFVSNAMTALLGGWMSLPLSLLHTLQFRGENIINPGGRPLLLLYHLIYWIIMIYLQYAFIRHGKQKIFIAFAIIALLSAPFSAFYANALLGL